MRVIAGKHRGRTLCGFKGDFVRPTSDRAREALFNILQGEIRDSAFLDLFCGSGAIGIEALSRGAKKVTFVDKSEDSLKITRKNLEKIGESALTVNADALNYIKNSDEKYDIIFLDPPYAFDASKVLTELPKILSVGGLIIYEHGENTDFSNEYLILESSRRYGIAIFDFFRSKQ